MYNDQQNQPNANNQQNQGNESNYSQYNTGNGQYQRPYYYQTPQSNGPSIKQSKSRAPVALMVLLAFVAGLLGGVFSDYLLGRNTDATNSNVTIQTVAGSPGTSATNLNNFNSESIYYAQEVAANASDSVVEVVTESKVTHSFFGSFVTSGAGSGVIISSDGYIVTNNHVIENSNAITVRTYNGDVYSAVLVGTDIQTDLAVIKINANNLHPAIFADSDQIAVGQPAIAIGNPLGTLGGTVTEGIISAKDREMTIDGDVMRLLQTSAAINQGNSGGGLFNKEGHLVGIVNAKSSGTGIEGLGFAIPANTVKQTVSELIAYGYVTGRPAIGIVAIDITNRNQAYQYRVSEYGVYVSRTDRENGLASGDRIVAINGNAIDSAAAIKEALNNYSVGDTIEIQVSRNGKNTTISVTLREKGQSETNSDVI